MLNGQNGSIHPLMRLRYITNVVWDDSNRLVEAAQPLQGVFKIGSDNCGCRDLDSLKYAFIGPLT